MARIRTRSQFQFDSAARQLDTRDLDNITDPTTDMGGAVADAVAEFSEAAGTDIIPPYPGLDLMEGEITGPLSLIGTDFSDLAAAMGRASGFEDYPAELPSLGTWSTAGDSKVAWEPTVPGIYQWYVLQVVDLSGTIDAGTWLGFRNPLPDIIDETWGADIERATQVDSNTWQAAHQGMLMCSAEMKAAGFGKLNIFGPRYEIGGAEQADRNYLFVAVTSWTPAGTVPYLDGI